MFRINAVKKTSHGILGFTIIEILVVIGILMVLVALVTPNILRSRILAIEGVALTNVKAISNGCQQFHIDHDTYPTGLSELVETNPPYIDVALASGNKKSYNFVYSTTSTGFNVNANPTGLLKGRYFYTDESGTVRVNANSAAGPDDPAIE